jgi:outer membrane immunogenic protein
LIGTPQTATVSARPAVLYDSFLNWGLPLRRLSIAAIVATTALAFTQLAAAADLGRPVYKAPPPPLPPPIYNWTGFYIGGNGGYAWGGSNVSTTVASAGTYFVATDVLQIDASGQGNIRPNGGTGGIQAGYNWQAGNFVYGAEVDFDALSLSGSRSITTQYLAAAGSFFTINQSIKTDWLFTARPRVGLATNNWLWYVTGGVAVTDLKFSNVFTDTFAAAFEDGSISKTKAGWVIGGGVEYGFTQNWSLKAEYLHMDFGNVSSTGAVPAIGGTGGAQLNNSADLKVNLVRAGINYRF